MSWEAKTLKRLLIRRRWTSGSIARLTVWDTGFSNLNLTKRKSGFQFAAEGISLALQAQLTAVAATAQEGVANLLGSIQETLAPKAEEKQDPEVKDFRQILLALAQ